MEKAAKNLLAVLNTPIKYCKYHKCGKILDFQRSKRKDSKYCSELCRTRDSAVRRYHRIKNNKRYIEARNKYNKEYYKENREKFQAYYKERNEKKRMEEQYRRHKLADGRSFQQK